MADLTNGNSKESGSAASGPELKRMETAGSITITPEMFERLYLAPQNKVRGEARTTFANPTPFGLAGFLMAYTPLIIQFLGWRGAGSAGVATVGIFYYFGGLLAVVAGVGEFILGNSFPLTFFFVYGGFFFYYGATLTPYYGALSLNGGAMNPEFLASNAFVSIFMSIFSFYATICATRVNILFVIAFTILTIIFGTYAGAQFAGARGDLVTYEHLTFVSGAIGFVDVVVGWYLLLVLMLSTVDFPLPLPVGDLSKYIKSGTEIAKAKARKQGQDS